MFVPGGRVNIIIIVIFQTTLNYDNYEGLNKVYGKLPACNVKRECREDHHISPKVVNKYCKLLTIYVQ